LPAGDTSEHSQIIVVNTAPWPTVATVDVAATTTPATGSGETLPPWSTQIVLPAHSEQQVPLRTTGPAQNDAASVVSTKGAVAVFEAVAPVAGAGTTHTAEHTAGTAETLQATRPAAPEESPCAVGTSPTSYLATGSTLGNSSVSVSLYDPTATEAVVGLSVSTGSALVTPPALQGLIIKPDSVQVFDIGRWVVQQPTVAVTVAATVGRVVVGAAETQGATQNMSGQALMLGVQRPQPAWIFAPGPLASGRVSFVRVYDPGPRQATVTISSPIAGHAPMEITAVIPAEGVRAIALPLPGAAHTASGQQETTSKARVVEGPIVVRSAQSVGVVVARVASVPAGGPSQTMTNVAVTSGPATSWVLPTVPAQVPLVGLVEVSNPGRSSVRVHVTEMPATRGRSQSPPSRTVTVGAGATVGVSLSIPVSGSSFGALFVSATAPVVVEEDLAILSTVRGTPPLALCLLEGVPVIG